MRETWNCWKFIINSDTTLSHYVCVQTRDNFDNSNSGVEFEIYDFPSLEISKNIKIRDPSLKWGGSETRFPWGMRIYIKDLLPNVFILRSRNDLYPTFSNRGYWIDPRDWIFRERNETILRISILEIDEASRANLFIKFSVLFFHPPRWN